jgi:hypothetical protein
VRTHLINVGTALVDRALAPQHFRSPGLWKDSSFKTQLCQLTAGNLAASVFSQTGATAIPVFLFSHDAPVYVQGFSRYTGIQLVDSNTDTLDINRLDFLEDTWFHGDAGAAPMNTVLTAASVTGGAAGVNVGARVAATTLTNTIQVQGYPFVINLEDQSLQDNGQADIDAGVFLWVESRGVCREGPISTSGLLSYDGTGTVDPATAAAYPQRAACILRETDYTAAMRTANNQLTDGNGLVVDILGLHAIPA